MLYICIKYLSIVIHLFELAQTLMTFPFFCHNIFLLDVLKTSKIETCETTTQQLHSISNNILSDYYKLLLL